MHARRHTHEKTGKSYKHHKSTRTSQFSISAYGTPNGNLILTIIQITTFKFLKTLVQLNQLFLLSTAPMKVLTLLFHTLKQVLKPYTSLSNIYYNGNLYNISRERDSGQEALYV